MKTLLLLVGVMTTINCLSQTNVPSIAQSSFTKLFSGIAVKKWDKEEGKYEANFTKEGKQMSAVFDTNGNLEEAETVIAVTESPPLVIPYVKENYRGCKTQEAILVSKSN
jgi:hypothetical protein